MSNTTKLKLLDSLLQEIYLTLPGPYVGQFKSTWIAPTRFLMSATSGGIPVRMAEPQGAACLELNENTSYSNNEAEPQIESWASVIERSLIRSSEKNILEVVLEKDVRGSFSVSESDCAKYLMKLGLDLKPGVQVDGVQICPNGRGVILVTLKSDVDISEFCRYDVVDLTHTGIRVVMTKPAGKREVVVTFRGIHPNTNDETILQYLNKFGRVVSNKVVHGVYLDGPLKGMKNGNRSYKVELQPGVNIGSYHLLDGQKVTARYNGQQQTCARCLQTARDCKGYGVAKKCELEGGKKMDFGVYITRLWKRIGYLPEVSNIVDDDSNVELQTGGEFTPQKVTSSPELFTGVVIKNIPKEIDQGEVVEFLLESGLPEVNLDAIQFEHSGAVSIRNIDNRVCLLLIENLHEKRVFSRRIYCNGIVPLTPQKNASKDPSLQSHPTDPALNSSTACNPDAHKSSNKDNMDQEFTGSNTMPQMISPLASPIWPGFTTEDLARRHSLSLIDRTPPPGSLASELLDLPKPTARNKSSLASIKDLAETLSEFNSCVSSTEGSEIENLPVCKSPKKRKRKKSSEKKNLAKKADLKASPEIMPSSSNSTKND